MSGLIAAILLLSVVAVVSMAISGFPMGLAGTRATVTTMSGLLLVVLLLLLLTTLICMVVVVVAVAVAGLSI